jgi:hypothetical protein
MNDNKVVAALLAVACDAPCTKATGTEGLDCVWQNYEYFLKRLAEKDSTSIPEGLRPMLEEVKKKQQERQRVKGK